MEVDPVRHAHEDTGKATLVAFGGVAPVAEEGLVPTRPHWRRARTPCTLSEGTFEKRCYRLERPLRPVFNLAVQDGAASRSDQMRSAVH